MAEKEEASVADRQGLGIGGGDPHQHGLTVLNPVLHRELPAPSIREGHQNKPGMTPIVFSQVSAL